MEKLNGLDLFSGIGGNSLGLRDYVKTVAYCERDRYATGVLLSRQLEGKLSRAPIWNDVTTFRREHLPTKIDIISGGFPCQDISIAGAGIGLEGERSGLFFEICRLVKEIKPSFVFLENVPNIRTKGLYTVVKSFTEMGYDCRWTCISAQSIGAPHKGERWFLLAYSKCSKLERGRRSDVLVDSQGEIKNLSTERKWSGNAISDSSETIQVSTFFKNEDYLAHSYSMRELQSEGCIKNKRRWTGDSSWWETEPNVGRVVDGLPKRVDRIRCLGNAVVPEQAKKAFEILMGIK